MNELTSILESIPVDPLTGAISGTYLSNLYLRSGSTER